jgi:hypothetical protein
MTRKFVLNGKDLIIEKIKGLHVFTGVILKFNASKVESEKFIKQVIYN